MKKPIFAAMLAALLVTPSAGRVGSDFVRPATIDPAIFSHQLAPKRATEKNFKPYPTGMMRLDGMLNPMEEIELFSGQVDALSDASIANMRAKIADAPGIEQNHIALALGLAQAHRFAESVAAINELLKVIPHSVLGLMLRGHINAALGRDDLAVRDFEAADRWNFRLRMSTNDSAKRQEHDDVELIIKAVLAQSVARAAMATGSAKHKERVSQLMPYLDIKMKYASDRKGFVGAYERAKAAVAAMNSGLQPVQMDAFNVAIDYPPTACATSATLDAAIAKNYRKQAAAGRLIELHELCGDFAKAAELRATDKALLKQRPYANTMFRVQCPNRPEMLHAALSAGYERFGVGLRLTRFYISCGAMQQVVDAAGPAVDDASTALSNDFEGVRNDYIELQGMRATAFEKLQDWKGAAMSRTSVFNFISHIEKPWSELYRVALKGAKISVDRAIVAGVNEEWLAIDKRKVDASFAEYESKYVHDPAICAQGFDSAAQIYQSEVDREMPPGMDKDYWAAPPIQNLLKTCRSLLTLYVESRNRQCQQSGEILSRIADVRQSIGILSGHKLRLVGNADSCD